LPQKRQKIVKLAAVAITFPVGLVPKLDWPNLIAPGRTIHGESNTVSGKSLVAGRSAGTRVGAVFDRVCPQSAKIDFCWLSSVRGSNRTLPSWLNRKPKACLARFGCPTKTGRNSNVPPSLPGFSTQVGTMAVGPKGGSCGTAVYRKEPVYVTDIPTDPLWKNYRERMLPYGIRSVWSRPLFTSEGKALGTFSINYRESRSP
jgi:hypothetical protein